MIHKLNRQTLKTSLWINMENINIINKVANDEKIGDNRLPAVKGVTNKQLEWTPDI